MSRPTINTRRPMGVAAALLSCGVWLGATAQTPALTPISFLSGDRSVSAAAGDQTEPVIVRGGNALLAVWTDARSDLAGAVPVASAYATGSEEDILAIRLDASGNPIDTVAFPIVVGAATQERPAVAWNGTHWLVVWVSQEPTQSFWAAGVRATRVTPQGQVLDSPPISVFSYPFSQDADIAITSDGTNWIVAARGTSSGESNVIGTRISPQGTVLDPGGKVLHNSPTQLVFGLRLATAQNTVLMAWLQSGRVNARRFDAALSPLGQPFLPAGSAGALAIDSNGSEFLLAWQQRGIQPFTGTARATRITPAGVVRDPGGFLITSSTDAVNSRTHVAWDGVQWYATYGRSVGLGSVAMTATRITPGGVVLDPNGIRVSSGAANIANLGSAVAGRPGGGALVAWVDRRVGGAFPNDIQAASIAAIGQVGPETAISLGAPAQWPGDIATDGVQYVAVFRSETSGVVRLLAQRLDGSGIAASAPAELARNVTSGPRIAWNGSRYLVAWSDGTARAVRLAADGTPIDAQPITVMPGTVTDVAALGDEFLVVGTHTPVRVEQRHAFGTRVRGTDGAVIGQPIQLGGSFARVPAAAALGNRWLIAWQQHFSHDNPNTTLRAVFLDQAGQTTITFPMGGGTSPYQVAMASNGNLALVAWHDRRNGTSNRDVFATRVRPDGSQPDPGGRAVGAAPGHQVAPAVGWDGRVFQVAWQDQRVQTFFIDQRFDIHAARVDTAGMLLDPNGFPITTAIGADLAPAIAGGGGDALFAVSTFAPQAPFASLRFATRATGALASPWTNLGLGHGGTRGVPRLTGSGNMTSNPSIALTVTNAAPNTLGLFGIGTTRIDAPLLGGTLVPNPAFLLPFRTGSQGEYVLRLPWGTVARGLKFYLQAWVVDATAPQSWSATNALQATVP